MALIECVECGSLISSFATACPKCGCPSGQKNSSEKELTDETQIHLKNYTEWETITDNIVRGEWLDAIDSIMRLTKCPNYVALEIVKEIEITHEIPVDLILERIPDQRVQPTTKPCSACGKTISFKAETCPHCGQPTGVHVCPRCGSTDVVYIDGVSKAASMMLFGIFSVNTVRNKYECWECHFKF